MYTEKIITRDKLYDLVWSKPMTEIAKEYGVSDKMIAKICDKLNVPTPGLGYWRKREVGENIPKPRLPDISPEHPTEHIIRKREEFAYEMIISDEANSLVNSLKDPLNKIKIPERVGQLHHSIKATKESLQPYSRGSIIFNSNHRQNGIFKVTVSKQEISRLFNILNTIIIFLEKNHFPVYVKENFLTAKMFGVEIPFSIREKIQRVYSPLKPGYSWRDYTSKSTGIVQLFIENVYVDYPIRKNFIDNKSGKVEDKLNEFITALINCSQAMIAYQKDIDERHGIMQQKEEKREAIRIQIKEEEQKIAELERNIELFNKANIIRNYIEKLQMKLSSVSDDERKELEGYINWSLEQADRFDPLVESPKSVLDLKEKVSRWGWDPDEE